TQGLINGCVEILLGGSWPIQRGLSAAIAAWGAPARAYMRTFAGISTSPPSRGSVCVIEPWRSQYSPAVWLCTINGSVSGRLSTLSTFPVDGSAMGVKLNG